MKKGFTLIEILIAMAILTAISLAVMYFALDVSEFSVYFSSNIILAQELQQSLRGMLPDIRSMGVSDLGAYPIVSATAQQLIVYTDIDQDGSFEQVRYFIEGGTFKKGTIEVSGNPPTYNSSAEITRELVHYIITGASSSFRYYGAGSSVPLPFPVNVSDIRVIKFGLVVDDRPGALPGPLDFSITARIRNTN
jgi:prepilin-type N-terminal cleavage/methylation domain-containing protein